MERKNDLPIRAKRYLYPQVFWAELPFHTSFSNQIREKFNQCLQNSVKQYNEMKILRIRRRWNFDDLALVSSVAFSDVGRTTFWSAIDKAIEFWENGRRKMVNNRNQISRDFIQKVKAEHATREQLNTRKRQSGYRQDSNYGWKRQRKLPKPPTNFEE